jgi:hypothetical protein
MYDLFISHASEDKETVAKPLACELRRRGYRVWLDRFELKLGDSLSRTIDRGLAESKYGAVILSKYFFAKKWPERELSGLVSREMSSGEKVILPIWHEVTHDEVVKYSPPLADRLSASTGLGLSNVADQIAAVLGAPLDAPTVTSGVVTKSAKRELPSRPSRLMRNGVFLLALTAFAGFAFSLYAFFFYSDNLRNFIKLTLDTRPVVRDGRQDATPPPKIAKELVSGKTLNVGSGAQYDGYRNPGCQPHQATACVTPQHGGKLIPGTGKVIVLDQSGRAGFRDPVEDPQQYCVTFWANTGACETPVFIRGYLTAVEEYTAEEGRK